MSLPIPNLDDRRFQDLVDEAKRMIPQLCPEWTNHNVSDPGVALIELFAWMTEMTVFRVNQVPDSFYTHMLNLLGFEQFPAAAARADVTFWVADSAPTVHIPAGTRVSTPMIGGGDVTFSTLADAVVEQPVLMGALTRQADRYVDVWDDLSLGLAPVVCFPGQLLTPGDSFYLGFDRSVAGTAVRLSITASAEGIGVIPDRPPLVWEAWQGEGWATITIPTLSGATTRADTTGGLNRDGTILMMMPARHEPLTLGGVQAHWIRARLVEPERDQPSYRSSPRLRGVTASAIGMNVTAEHSERVDGEVLGTSTGRPGQRFVVRRTPVLPREPGETLVVGEGDDAQDWTEVADFVDSGPGDRHFCWDSTTGEVVLGPLIRYPDGSTRQHGAVPPEGARLRITEYRSGGGAIGNVGSGTLSVLKGTLPYVTSVTNLAPASGGVDPETVENAKLRGPQSLRAGGRAVTVSDFERLAGEADSGIGRVRCLAPVEPGDPVRLLVVPRIEQPPETLQLDDFALPDDMIRRIGEHLDDRRILGSKIEIGTPYYQGVTVAALVSPRPGRPPAVVRQRALAALYDFVNPLTGGPEGRGWAFDADLNAAQVFQLLDAVEGVERVDEVLFFEYDLRNQERIGFGKELVKLAADSLFLSSNHQVVVR